MATVRYIFPMILILLGACVPVGEQVADPQALIEADEAFSAMSVEQGMQAAFLHFAHEEAVLLRPGGLPVEGLEAVSERLSLMPDSGFVLRWSPSYAGIAASGDLGYTYGKWYMDGSDTLLGSGTYVSIWKQDSTGTWKWILDTGNEGLGSTED